ncbi:MAG: J domain-containing protein [Chloroflexota bacterium]
MEYKDYYQTLGVSKNADEKEIKKAFRTLAQKYHPDKNSGDADAEKKFKEINEAYTVLSDTEKRSQYDRFGSQWDRYARTGGNPQDFWQQWGGAGGSPGGNHTRTVTPEEFERMFGGMGGGMGSGGFSDFFETLFGGAQPGGFGQPGAGFDGYNAGPSSARRQAPRSSEVPVQITLEEAFSGATRTLANNDGTRFEVTIPKGVKTGSKVRVRDPKGAVLYLKITIEPRFGYKEEGDNLRVSTDVDLYTAVLGGEINVNTIERTIALTIPAGTQNGKIFRLRGLGIPNLKDNSTKGDLLVEVNVVVPTTLTEEQKNLFEQLRDSQ